MSFGLRDDELARHYEMGAAVSHLEGLRAVSRLTAAAGIRTVLRPASRAVKPRGTRRPPAPSTLEGRVYLGLGARRGSSPAGLADSLGLTRAQVSAALRRLATKGFVRNEARGRWVRT